MRAFLLISLAISPFLAGCGTSPPTIPRASYDPEGIARAALQEYDRNGNGTIEGAELDACPPLKAVLLVLDTNGDRKVSVEELAARFKAYASTPEAYPVSITVNLDGHALEGATVVFTPERFMGAGFKPASGTTDKDGLVDPTVEGAGAPGMPWGLYRITVSKKDASGRELIPARYNAQTTLGAEVFAGGRGGNSIELNLSGR
jgi:EF hand